MSRCRIPVIAALSITLILSLILAARVCHASIKKDGRLERALAVPDLDVPQDEFMADIDDAPAPPQASTPLEAESSPAAQQLHSPTPALFGHIPFIALLLCIALLPLNRYTSHAWEKNSFKLALALIYAAATCAYYLLRPHGFQDLAPGYASLEGVIRQAIFHDYIPFIVLLFSLYTISGGISLRGDVPAHPLMNTAFLALGACGASLIGTTGMSMLLIRPLLQINSERRHVKHTVIFFIFLVSNVGGLLLPLGDPPLFLGYLRGVPFWWTLNLLPQWLTCTGILLAIYWVIDTIAYRKESPRDIALDESIRQPLALKGKINFVLLAAVLATVALLVPGTRLPGTNYRLPDLYLRETILIALSYASLRLTSKQVRIENNFNFTAIAEVAFLFIGIFITMQVPIEALEQMGPALGMQRPWQFFWASGALSSFLDNAPTYVVFFSTAATLNPPGMELMHGLNLGSGLSTAIPIPLLAAVSCGAVFMGANSYIGNGPNFMVKSIAEQHNVRMPSFFGYMIYSGLILVPVFLLMTFIFFV